jgi:hypothetical protein
MPACGIELHCWVLDVAVPNGLEQSAGRLPFEAVTSRDNERLVRDTALAAVRRLRSSQEARRICLRFCHRAEGHFNECLAQLYA